MSSLSKHLTFILQEEMITFNWSNAFCTALTCCILYLWILIKHDKQWIRNVEKNIQASTAQLWTRKGFKLRGQKGSQTKVSFYIRNSEFNLHISPQRKE